MIKWLDAAISAYLSKWKFNLKVKRELATSSNQLLIAIGLKSKQNRWNEHQPLDERWSRKKILEYVLLHEAKLINESDKINQSYNMPEEFYKRVHC